MNAVMLLIILCGLLAFGFFVATTNMAGAMVLPLAIFAALFAGIAAGMCIGLWLRPEFDGKDDEP